MGEVIAWITRGGKHVPIFDTDSPTQEEKKKEHDITESKKQADKLNGWKYPGIKDAITKIEKSNISAASRLKAIDGQLAVIDAAIQTDGSNSYLVSYRRQLRQMRQKLLEGK